MCGHRQAAGRIPLAAGLIYDRVMLASSRIATTVLTLSVVAPSLAIAQFSSEAPSFITPQTLAAQLADPRLVLLHVGDKGEYALAIRSASRIAYQQADEMLRREQAEEEKGST